jgi:hypothetical protein
MTEPMEGRVVSADFEQNTLTLEMQPGYYARASEYVLLPKEAWQWLMGMGLSFEPTSKAPYWWRSALREMIADDRRPAPQHGGDSNG